MNRQQNGEGHSFDKAFLRYNRAAAGSDKASASGSDDAIDAAADEHATALADLLDAPAPDLSSVVAKLDTILGEKGLEVHTGIVERLAADLRSVDQQQHSLILALHARYESAWDEYDRLENASMALKDAEPPSEEHSRKLRISDGETENQREIDSLRLAILYQVPSTWQEALVLAKHVHSAFAITDSFDTDHNDPERRAFETGLGTLLDFMFGEIDHEGIGGYQMEASERIVRDRRRFRTAELEEDGQ